MRTSIIIIILYSNSKISILSYTAPFKLDIAKFTPCIKQTVRKRKFSKNSPHSELRMCKILICRLHMLPNNLINVNDIVGLV